MTPAFKQGFLQKCASETLPLTDAEYLLFKAAEMPGLMDFLNKHKGAIGAGLGGAALGGLAGNAMQDEHGEGGHAGLGALLGGAAGAAGGHLGIDAFKSTPGTKAVYSAMNGPVNAVAKPMADIASYLNPATTAMAPVKAGIGAALTGSPLSGPYNAMFGKP